MLPKISVIMSVYNTEPDFLHAAVTSILKQTFDNFEFIIVLDRPTDGSESILEQYAAEDSRIVLIRNEENIGLTKSLNKALRIARGEYIARMDADDFSMPERFEKQVAYLESHKDVGVVGSYAYIAQQGKRGMPSLFKNNETNKIRFLFFNTGIPHPTAMFRRILPDGTAAEYDESIKKSQDYALWSELVQKTKIDFIPEFLVLYRIHEAQISNAPEKQFAYAQIVSQRQLESHFDFSSDEKYRDYILHAYFHAQDTAPFELAEAFSFLIKENAEKKYFSKKRFKRVVRALQLEYLLHHKDQVKTAEQRKKSIKGISVLDIAFFVGVYIFPRMKYDGKKKKFQKNNRGMLDAVLNIS